MSRLSLKTKWSDFKRLRFILSVIFESGGSIWIEKLKLKHLVPLRCKIHCFFHRLKPKKCLVHKIEEKHLISPKVLRSVLEKLGPTFIKLGQVLSLRADLVGEEISQELSKLQTGAPSFPYKKVREIIKNELGKYPEEIFKTFEKKPVAAASLAQVHRAVLKNGTEVAVKVQRPEVKEIIEKDIHILFYLAHLIERFMPEMRFYQPHQIVKEFAEWTLRELDFKTEGHNADRFRAMFEDNPHVSIPKIHWDFSSKRILSMNFMDGLKANEIKLMKEKHIDTKAVALHAVEALLKQFFIEGFFHADPHPGNFFVLKNNIVCLHDFGMVGYFDHKQRQELLSCFVAFSNQDIESFQKHFLHLAELDEKSEISQFKKDISTILSEFFYSPKQPSIAWAFFRMINAGAKYKVRFQTDLVLFAKALITTESMGLALYPEFNFNEQFKPFIIKAYKEYLNPKKALKTFESDFFDYVELIKTLPEKTQKMIEKIEKSEIGVKINSEELFSIKKEFDRQNDLRILGVILTALIIVTGILFHLEGRTEVFGLSLSNIGLGLFILLFVWFLIKLGKGPKE